MIHDEIRYSVIPNTQQCNAVVFVCQKNGDVEHYHLPIIAWKIERDHADDAIVIAITSEGQLDEVTNLEVWIESRVHGKTSWSLPYGRTCDKYEEFIEAATQSVREKAGINLTAVESKES